MFLGYRGIGLTLVAAFSLAASACGGVDDGEDVGESESAIIPLPAPGDPSPPASLKTVSVPEPADLATYVKDKAAAIRLGKALFWDMQAGSDGIQACGSCHFHAGADSRAKNQVSPGLQRVHAPSGEANPDLAFDISPNSTLTAADFPLRKLANPDDRNSEVLEDTNDVVGSQGVASKEFVGVVEGEAQDQTAPLPDQLGFRVGTTNVREVEPRHTPTVINAVFNFRQFWDGRAQAEFNGVNHLGARDTNAILFFASTPHDTQPVKVRIGNASLASQAVAPPLSSMEMSAAGRRFPDVGRKLLSLRPLAKQVVHADDSVLGAMSRAPNKGLGVHSYENLVKAAFRSKWWNSAELIQVDDSGNATVVAEADDDPTTDEYSMMEYNFSLFWGLAIQLYEATLVADDTPFDRFQEGDKQALSPQAQTGMLLFMNQTRGKCVNCHGGPELTLASVTAFNKRPLNTSNAGPIRRREGNIVDMGFNNIGVRPAFEDIALGANDSFDMPLSFTKLAVMGVFDWGTPVLDADRVGVDGAFKVPGIRNVELSAPFFHNGGARTLRDILDFYSRGGDFAPIQSLEGKLISGLTVLVLSEEEKQALEAFLLALTDERVRTRSAPFDAPQLFVPDGHPGDETSVTADATGTATDSLVEIPAVGRNGGAPLRNFLD
jgi:cytochrome c peroxidase